MKKRLKLYTLSYILLLAVASQATARSNWQSCFNQFPSDTKKAVKCALQKQENEIERLKRQIDSGYEPRLYSCEVKYCIRQGASRAAHKHNCGRYRDYQVKSLWVEAKNNTDAKSLAIEENSRLALTSDSIINVHCE